MTNNDKEKNLDKWTEKYGLGVEQLNDLVLSSEVQDQHFIKQVDQDSPESPAKLRGIFAFVLYTLYVPASQLPLSLFVSANTADFMGRGLDNYAMSLKGLLWSRYKSVNSVINSRSGRTGWLSPSPRSPEIPVRCLGLSPLVSSQGPPANLRTDHIQLL